MPVTFISLECSFCNSSIKRTISKYNQVKKLNQNVFFCSQTCSGKYKSQTLNVESTCSQCSKKFIKKQSQAIRSKNSFCSCSCAATYNNAHKTKGTRRSKLEKYLEEQLAILFPNIEILFNCKDVINSELDIYIPDFKLAIELNGIYHFKPIYGEKKLKKIQDNDLLKIEACNRQFITLVNINTCKQKKWNRESSQKYLDTISELINSYLVY